MRTRVLTAVIALILFVPFVVIGGFPLSLVMAALSLIAMGEILYMKNRSIVSPEALIAFILVAYLSFPTEYLPSFLDSVKPAAFVYFASLALLVLTVFSKTKFTFDTAGVILLAAFYISFGFKYFAMVRAEQYQLLIYALIVVWATDSFAYIVGRMFGKHKLIPKVSPNKTWEGSIGGSVIGTIAAVAYMLLFNNQLEVKNIFILILVTFVLTIAGQVGDLIESAFKRFYGVKDSGKILPGHGGILDRFDSLLIVIPMIYFVFAELF